MYRLLLDVRTVDASPCWGLTVNAEEIDVEPAIRINDRADLKETILDSIVFVRVINVDY